jgi:CheY-like chemotaxis protein
MFTIRLPLRAVYTAPTDLETRRKTLLKKRKFLSGVRALIIDDELEVRTLLTLTLEKYGAKTQSASCGKDALELLLGQRPNQLFNVLICDISMPDEDGYAFIRKVRALPAKRGGTIPAIALTAYGSIEHRMRALDAGFQTYAVKPVEPDELIAAIRSLIEDLHTRAA